MNWFLNDLLLTICWTLIISLFLTAFTIFTYILLKGFL